MDTRVFGRTLGLFHARVLPEQPKLSMSYPADLPVDNSVSGNKCQPEIVLSDSNEICTRIFMVPDDFVDKIRL